jgi:hypothetical protein
MRTSCASGFTLPSSEPTMTARSRRRPCWEPFLPARNRARVTSKISGCAQQLGSSKSIRVSPSSSWQLPHISPGTGRVVVVVVTCGAEVDVLELLELVSVVTVELELLEVLVVSVVTIELELLEVPLVEVEVTGTSDVVDVEDVLVEVGVPAGWRATGTLARLGG